MPPAWCRPASACCASCCRIETRTPAAILIDGMVEIPAERLEQAKRAAEVVDTEIFEKFPMVDGLRPMNED